MTEPHRAPLHILTSDEIVARPGFETTAAALLDIMGAQGILHLRTRQLSGGAYVALTARLAQVARGSGAALIVNGRVDVALAGGATGVQLGRGALTLRDVRHLSLQGTSLSATASSTALLPTPLRVGVSIHHEHEAAEVADADWVMAGHVFETKSHPDERARGLAFIQRVAAATTCPVIAVGGITPETVHTVRAAGAAGVAVLSGIWDSAEPEDAITHYL